MTARRPHRASRSNTLSQSKAVKAVPGKSGPQGKASVAGAPNGVARLLFLPHQVDGLEAAERLGRWMASALAALEVRDGGMVLRLGDLLDLRDLGVRRAGPAVPPEPAALAITGSPGLVADFGRLLRAQGRSRLVTRRIEGPAPLPVAAVVADGVLHVGESPELIPHGPSLAAAGWKLATDYQSRVAARLARDFS